MKDVALKLISELMKNSRKSDRELAKIIGVSQPTVTRIRAKLEKEGYIEEYTLIPNFQKLGFHLAAISFLKLQHSLTSEETEQARKTGEKLALESFPEVIVAERGRGLGYQAVFISFHKSYQAYIDYMDSLKKMKFMGIPEFESFLISLDDKIHYRYLTLSTLAKYLMRLNEEKEE
jgi:DNA-binding Lrp family transcriptional regulator